jgi:hypothetical protein
MRDHIGMHTIVDDVGHNHWYTNNFNVLCPFSFPTLLKMKHTYSSSVGAQFSVVTIQRSIWSGSFDLKSVIKIVLLYKNVC